MNENENVNADANAEAPKPQTEQPAQEQPKTPAAKKPWYQNWMLWTCVAIGAGIIGVAGALWIGGKEEAAAAEA